MSQPHEVRNFASSQCDDLPAMLIDVRAYRGLAGRFVQLYAPHTEASPDALLLSFLTHFGAAVGAKPTLMLGPSLIVRPVLFTVILAPTGQRKSTAINIAAKAFKRVDPDFAGRRIGGLGSGEILIDVLRMRAETGSSDPEDLGLVIVEHELGSVLKKVRAKDSVLGEVLRGVWDGDRIEARSRSGGTSIAETHHAALLAAITPNQLTTLIDETWIFNGFLNRFLFLWAESDTLKPIPGSPPQSDLDSFDDAFHDALHHARSITTMQLSDEAISVWERVYPLLRTGRSDGPEVLGAMTERADVHVLRLAMIYSLLDGSAAMAPEHLGAALAVWMRADQSVEQLMKQNTPEDAQLLTLLDRAGAAGMSKTDLTREYGNRTPKLNAAIARQRTMGTIVSLPGPGRAARYYHTRHALQECSADEPPA